jgi:hypothetical protein
MCTYASLPVGVWLITAKLGIRTPSVGTGIFVVSLSTSSLTHDMTYAATYSSAYLPLNYQILDYTQVIHNPIIQTWYITVGGNGVGTAGTSGPYTKAYFTRIA